MRTALTTLPVCRLNGTISSVLHWVVVVAELEYPSVLALGILLT